jgi:hypothetical protein
MAVVIFTITRHEFWRDEVRALSLARAAASPLDLYGLVQYDGHPVLWHLLLYIGKSIVDTPLVLPVVSVLVAFAAVTLFMLAAPFPFWMRSLFVFSAPPLYEYSVIARNYGISMLLLFVAAVLYRTRATHPYRLALALALLANTNVHSAIFACLIVAVWAWDIVEESWREGAGATLRSLVPLAIVLGGVAMCAVFAMPRENTVATSVRHSLDLGGLASAILSATTRPDRTFDVLVPESLPTIVTLLVFGLALLGLVTRFNLLLAAVAAQIGLGVLFRIVFPGYYRHQALYLLFLVVLYWVTIESAGLGSPDRKPVLLRLGLYGGLLTLIALNVVEAQRVVLADITEARSSSKAMGQFLNNSSVYRGALIVPEPDFFLESLPYYASNAIYLPREQRFGTTVSWTTSSASTLTLGELLSVARQLRAQNERPILIVLGGWHPERDSTGEKSYFPQKTFSWSAIEALEFREAAVLIREFRAPLGDEDYNVYALK